MEQRRMANMDREELELAARLPEAEWRRWLGAAVMRTEEQTKRTNGRVTKLELWQRTITGGIAVLTAVVIPLLLIVVSQHIT